MNKKQNSQRLLAIDPTTKGFAYVLFEGKTLIDWGVIFVYPKKKNELCLKRITELLEVYDPQVIVLEDTDAKSCLRRTRVRKLIAEVRTLVHEHRVQLHVISRRKLVEAFSKVSANNKDEIAREVADRLPELGPQLPPKRKIWMPEDPRINLFDAAALAMTLFEMGGRRILGPKVTRTSVVKRKRRAAARVRSQADAKATGR